MLRKCPPDMFSDWIQLHIFYDGITQAARTSLDNSAGGSFYMKKITKEALRLIEMVANNQYLYSSERTAMRKEVMKLDVLDTILAQNIAMCQQINAITQQLDGLQVSAINTQDAPYDMSGEFSQGENHDYGQFSFKQVNYMGNSSRPSNNDFFPRLTIWGGGITQILDGEINHRGNQISTTITLLM